MKLSSSPSATGLPQSHKYSLIGGRMPPTLRFLVVTALVGLSVSGHAQVPTTAFANFEGRQTNPIRFSPDGKFLLLELRSNRRTLSLGGPRARRPSGESGVARAPPSRVLSAFSVFLRILTVCALRGLVCLRASKTSLRRWLRPGRDKLVPPGWAGAQLFR